MTRSGSSSLRLAVIAAVLWLAAGPRTGAQQPVSTGDGIARLLTRLETVLQSGDADQYLELLSVSADRARAREFADGFSKDVTRAVVRERGRGPLLGSLPGYGYELLVDVFTESGDRGRVMTWRLEVRRMGGIARGGDATRPAEEDLWGIVGQEVLSTLDGLHRLWLNPKKQYTAKDLVIEAEDFRLSLASGSVFVSETADGVTALVLIGQGQMSFTPAPAAERGQVRIFCGSETLQAGFEAAFVRLHPADGRVPPAALQERAVVQKEFRRAETLFRQEVVKSFNLDLSDLSRDTWSIQPPFGDFLAEVRTRKYDTLTYARSATAAEDVTLFDRRRGRNIAVYASKQKLSARGRFYNEDDLEDFDVLDYNVEASFSPARQWIEGTTRLKIKVRSYALTALTLRLAEALVVQSVVSDQFGRLLALRVRNQNSIVVNLPAIVTRDTSLTLVITYAGRLPPQTVDREALRQQSAQQRIQEDVVFVAPEPHFLYSNRSYWYAQSPVTDYATATLRLTVPAEYSCVASGELMPNSPVVVGVRGESATKIYVFEARQPARYLAMVISRFVRVGSDVLSLRSGPADVGNGGSFPGGRQPNGNPGPETLRLAIEANPRQQSRGRELSARTAEVLRLYSSLLGDSPYPSFTLAVVEHELPGGHSPAYFAALNQPSPNTALVWRNDPANFNTFPDFFLAHELAHQWWGQAIGWKNFHEQWLSEGFAQYFAALYAERSRGDEVFASVIKQLRRWSMNHSDQGPVYLGYRLGHIKGDSRIFRALVYNKGAAVLHMLRRLVGDDVFFRGLRRFYTSWRFQKAGTDDLRQVFEAEASRPLERFFERWIYESGLPRARFSYRVEGSEAVLRFEQLGEVYDFPVTVTLQYSDKPSADLVVAVTDRIVEKRVPLAGVLRGIEVNRDEAALAEFVK